MQLLERNIIKQLVELFCKVSFSSMYEERYKEVTVRIFQPEVLTTGSFKPPNLTS